MRFLIIILLIGYSAAVDATDYLFENTAPVEVHKKKNSRYTFSSDHKAAESIVESESFAILYMPQVQSGRIDKEALAFQSISPCMTDEVKLDEVFHHTDGTDNFDVLIYDPRFLQEKKRAKNYSGVKVPWDPLFDATDNDGSEEGFFQDLARLLKPECLPARFRFVYIGSKRYMEIRYGKKVWATSDVKKSQDKSSTR
jgi:hypothetical protein